VDLRYRSTSEKRLLRFFDRDSSDYRSAFIARDVRVITVGDWKQAPATLRVAVVRVGDDEGYLAVLVHTMNCSGKPVLP
jgi:hypothetical protein